MKVSPRDLSSNKKLITVKPMYSDHFWQHDDLIVMGSWLLYSDILISDFVITKENG